MGLEMQENVILAPYTTYKIGGPARYFCEAKNEEEIANAVAWARKQNVPFFSLGGGSNILVSDNGFDGLVVRIKNSKLKIKNYTVEAEAGIDLPELIRVAIDSSLKGLEWASGIPGTFGGAIRGNAGAFGGEIKDSIRSVRFLDERGNIKEILSKDCNFFYRSSIFKDNPEYVILSATLQFSLGNKDELKEFSRKTIKYRASRHPLEYGSCGSVFKAIDVKDISEENFAKYPRFRVSIKYDPFPVVPAACFIDEAKLKGYQIGGAIVSAKHPNFFVNYNQARAKDVIMLMSFAKQRLMDTFGIAAEEEVQFIGFKSSRA